MASVATFLNFTNRTEEAFRFYAEVFGSEIRELRRFGEVPPSPGAPPPPPGTESLVLFAFLPILGGHELMGSDAPPQMGFSLTQGNNVHISLAPDTREEAERIFAAFSDKGTVEKPLSEEFWGGLFGSLTDRFGIHWLINMLLKGC